MWENHGNTDKGETFKNKKVFIPVIDQIIKQYIITPFVGFSKLIIFKISSLYSFFYCENLSLHLIQSLLHMIVEHFIGNPTKEPSIYELTQTFQCQHYTN